MALFKQTVFLILTMMISVCLSSDENKYLFDDPITMHFQNGSGNIVITIVGILILILLIVVISIILYRYCIFKMYEGIYKLSTKRLREHDEIYDDHEFLNDEDYEDSQYGTF